MKPQNLSHFLLFEIVLNEPNLQTHGLGHGRYHGVFGQHNYKEPTRIFIDHLSRVNAICLDLGLEPCIWR